MPFFATSPTSITMPSMENRFSDWPWNTRTSGKSACKPLRTARMPNAPTIATGTLNMMTSGAT